MDSGTRQALLDALRLQLDLGADEALADAAPDRLLAPAVPDRVLVAPLIHVVPPASTPRPAAAAAATDLDSLRAEIAAVDSPLRETATRLVFADGAPASGLMLVGDAPGSEDDREGRPFRGTAGALLDRMLGSIGLHRERDAYLTNILPWRPPGNRLPTEAELATFLPYLLHHIGLVRPQRLLLLGATPARLLLRSREGLTRLRGRFHPLLVGEEPVPCLVMAHPRALLEAPAGKRDAWSDLIMLRRSMDGHITK